MSDDEDGLIHRIGAVARLTGLPVGTIRTWERRHQAVNPARTSAGGRLYSDGDVLRLRHLKSLVEAGGTVRELAKLSTDELEARVASRPPQPPPSFGQIPVAVLHRSLPRILSAEPGARLRVEASADKLEDWPSAVADVVVDAIVLELELLGEGVEAALRSCREAADVDTVVVVYAYASSGLQARLLGEGARLLREPIDAIALARLLRPPPEPYEAPIEDEPPPYSFSDDLLARLRALPTHIECECPQNLAEIVQRLQAFERYSAACAARSPMDAAMHDYLRRGTGHARAIMEALLENLVRYEGISLDPRPESTRP